MGQAAGVPLLEVVAYLVVVAYLEVVACLVEVVACLVLVAFHHSPGVVACLDSPEGEGLGDRWAGHIAGAVGLEHLGTDPVKEREWGGRGYIQLL